MARRSGLVQGLLPSHGLNRGNTHQNPGPTFGKQEVIQTAIARRQLEVGAQSRGHAAFRRGHGQTPIAEVVG